MLPFHWDQRTSRIKSSETIVKKNINLAANASMFSPQDDIVYKND